MVSSSENGEDCPPPGNGKDLVIGYPKLAHKMGIIPEQAIFRQFSALGAASLLYRQAELVYLERELREVQREDNEDSDPCKQEYAVYWKGLNGSIVKGNGRQWKLLLQIRTKLKDYRGSKTSNMIKERPLTYSR